MKRDPHDVTRGFRVKTGKIANYFRREKVGVGSSVELIWGSLVSKRSWNPSGQLHKSQWK